MLNTRPALPEEFTAVRSFYHELIDLMEHSPYHPAWEKGVYPSDEYLFHLIQAGQLILGFEDNALAAAMAVNHDCNKSYAGVDWMVQAVPAQVTVIHILCVHPHHTGKGYAKQMVRYAIDRARAAHQRCIRLDVLSGNLPALRLYEGMGFTHVTTLPMFYEDTGWTDFLLYEFPL